MDGAWIGSECATVLEKGVSMVALYIMDRVSPEPIIGIEWDSTKCVLLE